ncbi:MAG: hypothetical protein DWQ09_17930 [Proteobacteria bacterium]|nr:MAG: hypothetical protein DWQ09_17930 [Pseudomonadota bacterium]QKK11941.1 MAG: hypothetical protein HND59_10465 [Pseudomonadota bacterium]
MIKPALVELPESRAALGSSAFETVLKHEVAELGSDVLSLRYALAQGNYVLDDGIEVIVLNVSETPETVRVKAGIHFLSILTGCACDDDPTPVSELNEYSEALVTIDRSNGAATILLMSD